MDRPDKTTIYLEHYKLMRQEILQNSAESIKALELGIAVVSALFALASSTVIPENARWLFFLFPPIVVSPLIMLIAQRFRQTRKIGTHIGQRIEPELGIIWEGTPQTSASQAVSPIAQRNKRITPRSLYAMSLPLMAVQCLSLTASAWYLLKSDKSSGSWLIWGVSAVFVMYLLWMENRVIQEALSQDFLLDA